MRVSPRQALKTLGLAAMAALVLAAMAACGEDEGVAEGAAVTAYVGAPLCAGATQELARRDGKAGELRVRVVCLSSPRTPTKLDLAQVGANARQATEDSTTVAVLEPPDTTASRFSAPILETAGIAPVQTSSGARGMRRLLDAIEASHSGSLRESVREELG
jgi:hypothetical protein